MRRTPPPIHLLAAAATDTTTATTTTTFFMSSRPPYRGRGREFSSRSYSGGRDQYVTGDAHFRSVRDANLGIRRGEITQNPHYNQRPRPPPPHLQNPQFRHHPPPPQLRPSPPPFDHSRPPLRPPQHIRPRPPDYREWEIATTPAPPSHCERFKVLSYNILADYLAFDHRSKLYFHIPRYMLDWQWRKKNIIFELGLWSADIMCLQEVDRFNDLADELKIKGYNGIWKMRTGNPIDGCAIFWRTSRFNFLYEECIEFNKLGLRDNVAQICVLEFINQNGSLPSSLTGSSKVVVCNIHVLYNPNRGEIKLGQVRVLLDKAKAVSKLWNNAPVVICGDFNCTPKSPLYNFISEQKLDLSGIDRDKVSGQASATIRARKLYGPNSSDRPANDSAQATSTDSDKEVNIELNNSLSDMQNPDTKSNSSENQYAHSVLDMSDKSGTNVQCGKESDTCAGKDTQETAVDHSKIFVEVDSVKEEPNPSYSEGIPSDHVSDEIHDSTAMTTSALEAVHSDTTGMGCTEHISDAVSTSNQESLSKKSNLPVPEGNKHMEFDNFPTSLQEDDQSSIVNVDLLSTDLLKVKISSPKPSSQTSVSDAFEVPHTGYGESPSDELIANDQKNSLSTSYLVEKSHQSTNNDFPLDKLEESFLDEIDKPMMGSENIAEDDNAFISALHNAEEGITFDLGPSMRSNLEKSYQFEELDSASNNSLAAESNVVDDDLSPSPTSKSIDADKTTYNPSLWTPMEIETATGNAECTFLEHPLPLWSTYTEAMDCSGTRDPHGEPLVTSYHRCFMGTVDYIWRSEGLQTTKVLAPIPKHAMEWTPGFPTKKWGSDHIALVSELAFLKDGTDNSREAQ